MLENNKNDHNGGNNTIYILRFNKPDNEPVYIVKILLKIINNFRVEALVEIETHQSLNLLTLYTSISNNGSATALRHLIYAERR